MNKISEKLAILSFLVDKENHNKWRSYVQFNETEDKRIKNLFLSLDNLHDTINVPFTIDDVFANYYHVIQVTKKEDQEFLEVYRTRIKEYDLSGFTVERLLIDSYFKDKLGAVAFDLMAVQDGHKTFDEVVTNFDELVRIRGANTILEASNDVKNPMVVLGDELDLDSLYSQTIKTPGLRWRIDSLNKSLGSLRKGNFVFIFARPESGKTTFLASEITHFASQTDDKILWFNNEQEGKQVLLRIYQASLGLTLHQLMEDRNGNTERFRELGGRNIKIIDGEAIHRRDVENFCKRFNPSCIVFDQIDKLKGFNGDREDLRLGSIYQWARELAKRYCPVIAVTQANGTGEGVKWLTMDHVSESKTSKQAEADAIIGIGKTNDPNLEFVRHINISKNKLLGDEDSIEEQRHARIDVIIEPEIARFRDVQ